MQYKKLNQKARTIWLIRNIIIVLVLLALFVFFYINILSKDVNEIVNIILIILFYSFVTMGMTMGLRLVCLYR